MDEREDIIELVRKCLALSRSSNEHEAARAAEKAQELMLKYKLSEAEVELKTEQKVGVTHTEYPAVSRAWRRDLAGAVSEAYFCKVLVSRRRGHERMVFVGKPTDIQITIMVYEWLASALDQICYDVTKHDLGERGNLTRWRNSWLAGAVYEVSRRLYEQSERQASDPTTQALVSTTQDALQSYAYEKLGAKRTSKSYNTTDMHRGAYAEGREAGKTIPLNRPEGIGKRKEIP